jgi:hypothetical protein
VLATLAAALAIVATWRNLGLPRLVFSPELAPLNARIKRSSSSTATSGSWCLMARQSARHALAGDGCGIRDVGWRKQPPADSSVPSGGRKRADLFCLGKIFDHQNTSLIEYMITHTMY